MFDFERKDVHGFLPDFNLIGDSIEHSRTIKHYVITGFAWIGETDEWGFIHTECGKFAPSIVRPLHHLCGVRSNGMRRYQEYLNYIKYALPHHELDWAKPAPVGEER